MYRTIADKGFWEFDFIIMQTLSDILPLFCTLTWPSHRVSENQELEGRVNYHVHPDIHLSVSTSHRVGPTHGQRKALTRVPIEFMLGCNETTTILYTARTKKKRRKRSLI